MTNANHKINNDIERANNLANWSFIGIFIPVAGWITGGMSITRLNRYTPGTSDRILFNNIRSKAWWGIALSTVTAIITIGSAIYNYQVANQEEQTKIQQQSQQNTLDVCLQNADDAYWAYVELNAISIDKVANTVQASQDTWDAANNNRKIAKDECYRRAAVQ